MTAHILGVGLSKSMGMRLDLKSLGLRMRGKRGNETEATHKDQG